MRDALPGAADPALEGPHMLPAAAIKLHGVWPEERGRDRYGNISGRVRWGAGRGWMAICARRGKGRQGVGRSACAQCDSAVTSIVAAATLVSNATAGHHAAQDYSKAKSAAAAPKVVKAVDKSKETPQVG